MPERPNAYAGIAILLSMLIAIGIGLYLLVMPVPTQQGGPGAQQGATPSGSTSYLGQVAQAKQTGNRMACMQQCRAVAQSITVVEVASLGGRGGPSSTQELMDALKADGQHGMLPFGTWESPTPASPPIVYVPERSRGTSGVLFYEHPDNHDGLGGHVAFVGGAIKWYDWEAFERLITPLPQPTW